MLPEAAWDLKPGMAIRGKTPEQAEWVFGHVQQILNVGFSREEYLAAGSTDMEARQRQYDPPAVLMKVIGTKPQYVHWRPDYVELVTDDYHIMCATCGVVVVAQLPLHVFERMQQGEPPDFLFEKLNPMFKHMIMQSRCGSCAIPGEVYQCTPSH